MKKLKLLMLFMLTTLFSFSQNWKELKVENGIKIEYSIQEKQDDSKGIHQEFIVLRLTNTENVVNNIDVIVSYDYGQGLTSNSENNTTISMSPNSVIIGDLNTNYLSIFKRFLNNISKTTLINFNIEINK